MHAVRMTVKADADGKLHVEVPVGQAGDEFEVELRWRPKAADGDDSPEARGWPPGFIERTAGSITDPAFRRYPQGEYEKRLELG